MARVIDSKYLLRGAALTFACLLMASLGREIQARSGTSPLIWAPSGVGLAALLIWDTAYWPWLFLAGLISGVVWHSPLPASFVMATGMTFGPWLGAKLFKKFGFPKPTLNQVPEIGVLVLGAMGVAALIGSAFEVCGLFLEGRVPAERLFESWRNWWLASAWGDLVITAALIAWCNDLRFKLGRVSQRKGEALCLFLAVSFVCALVYTPLAAYNHSTIIKPYLLFTLMLWASLRFELLGATLMNLIIAVATVTGYLVGFSAFSSNPPSERLVLIQRFSAAVGITGLVLAAAMREKMEAVEARNEFLGIASHELKTPITSLKLQLQISLRRLLAQPQKTPADETHLASLQKMDRQVVRLVQIIEQLLDVSQIERRNLVLQLEETDLSALIRNLVERLANDLTQAGCELRLDLPASSPCHCDAFRVEQVMENLLSNAIKYAPGKPTQVSVTQDERQLKITVSDQGPGIERSKLPFIFDRFVRASESPHIKGLGLGLFITRQIVEAHHGTISVDSPEGRGTTFVVSLPRA